MSSNASAMYIVLLLPSGVETTSSRPQYALAAAS